MRPGYEVNKSDYVYLRELAWILRVHYSAIEKFVQQKLLPYKLSKKNKLKLFHKNTS